jgi:hypothetical protein
MPRARGVREIVTSHCREGTKFRRKARGASKRETPFAARSAPADVFGACRVSMSFWPSWATAYPTGLRLVRASVFGARKPVATELESRRLWQEPERLPEILTAFFNLPPAAVAIVRQSRLGEFQDLCCFVFARDYLAPCRREAWYRKGVR